MIRLQTVSTHAEYLLNYSNYNSYVELVNENNMESILNMYTMV